MIKKIFRAKNSNERLAKGIILGSLMAILVGYLTLDSHYYSITPTGKKVVISTQKYDNSSYKYQEKFIRKNNYNTLFIILGLVSGTAIGYLLINEKE